MHPHTAEVAKNVRAASTIQEKLDALYNQYEGEDCWVIATGPSVAVVDNKELRACLEDKLVVSIKGSYKAVSGLADFHCINGCNSPKEYWYYRPVPITVTMFPRDNAKFRRPDYPFDIELGPTQMAESDMPVDSICATGNFRGWELRNNIRRHCGPGMMDEIGFPLPVHLGCKRIFTMGFDLGPGVLRYFDGGYAQPKWVSDTDRRVKVACQLPALGTHKRLAWLASHGIEWYRIASKDGSTIPAPTMNFYDAVGMYQDT